MGGKLLQFQTRQRFPISLSLHELTCAQNLYSPNFSMIGLQSNQYNTKTKMVPNMPQLHLLSAHITNNLTLACITLPVSLMTQQTPIQRSPPHFSSIQKGEKKEVVEDNILIDDQTQLLNGHLTHNTIEGHSITQEDEMTKNRITTLIPNLNDSLQSKSILEILARSLTSFSTTNFNSVLIWLNIYR